MGSSTSTLHGGLAPPRLPHLNRIDRWLTQRYGARLADADIQINGTRPWDMQVRNPRVFRRCLTQGTLGLGDAYVDGWWDAVKLDEFFEHLIRAKLDSRFLNLPQGFIELLAACCNLQSVKRARQVAEVHYDLNNSFYRAMLGPRMVYTCAYWAHATSLAAAQENKLELVCRKLDLRPGQRVLDIVCGWGSFAKYAAERYGVRVVGITISEAQAALARELCQGLPIEIRLQDYRDVREPFDRIVSLGMFEHVGRKNYRAYVDHVRARLAPDGLFLLHTIGLNDHGSGIDPWITKYIFPNSEIPSLLRVVQALDRRFVLEDLHNFGADYARTLLAWHDNFTAAWPIFSTQMPSRFFRVWKYYLLLFAGVFRARRLQLWQLVLSPHGVRDGYRRPVY